MISFPRSPLDSTLFCNEHVHIHLTFIIHKGKRLVVLDSCSKQWHPPFIMRADIIRVKYTGWTYSPHYGRLGFRMLYSFHKHSAVLLQQPGHVWNCSVPHWADFQQHFPCNLMADCSGGEDEAVCPYAGKPHCSEGEISVGDTCYEYVIPDEPLTWQEAAEQCRLRDAHLANLVTPSEWNKIMNILQVIDLSDIYIALQSADLSFPEMYKAMLQWSSKSISFYYAVNITTRKPFCTYRSRTLFWPREDFTSLATTACNQPRQANFLCERHLKANRTVLTTSPQLATPTEHFTDHHHRFIHCPRGHLTQSFLACDVHTDCWHHDVTAMTCQAPLTPLPPTFQCSNNLELVPYSLLCDSRSDCSDESDEDFCVFPPCVGAMVFDCGNGQCIPQHQRCDQLSQCLNEADEREQECTSFGLNTGIHATTSVWPPAAVHFNGRGNVTLISLQSGDTINHACPETHFACPGMEYYCMPVYVRCNDVNDCPGFEDETDCDSYTCSGYYRCRLNVQHVY
ncbi:uncharacterized protein LOC143274635 [Babylonia areolata]|uniref:uncharacterized protein LOC143274635 n=1 Tax=Babylonia areolata TaxID=304850 RepID=UPI003FD59A6A